MAHIFQIIIGSAAAYLLGMSVVGYACILIVIKERVTNSRQNNQISRCLTLLHYVLGILSVGAVPIIIYRRLRDDLPVQLVASFLISSVVVVVVIALAIRWINSKSVTQ